MTDAKHAPVPWCCDKTEHDEVVAAVRVCETTIAKLCEPDSTSGTQDWINGRGARPLARTALAKLETTP